MLLFVSFFVVGRDSKLHYVLFLLTITRSGGLAEIWWMHVSQNPREDCASHFPGQVIIIIIIIIIIYSLEFFTSLEFEWQQVSSSLQYSSQYSGRFQ